MDILSKYNNSPSLDKELNPEKGLTLGQERVRLSFNPGQNEMVNLIKNKTAELIDLCEQLKPLDARLASLAQTHYEDAAMWAVKAATTPIKD